MKHISLIQPNRIYKYILGCVSGFKGIERLTELWRAHLSSTAISPFLICPHCDNLSLEILKKLLVPAFELGKGRHHFCYWCSCFPSWAVWFYPLDASSLISVWSAWWLRKSGSFSTEYRHHPQQMVSTAFLVKQWQNSFVDLKLQYCDAGRSNEEVIYFFRILKCCYVSLKFQCKIQFGFLWQPATCLQC